MNASLAKMLPGSPKIRPFEGSRYTILTAQARLEFGGKRDTYRRHKLPALPFASASGSGAVCPGVERILLPWARAEAAETRPW